VKATFLLFPVVALTACSSAESRYTANIEHVYVSRWTHLTAADREQIVRLVSTATRQPLQGITTWKPGSPDVAVYTGFRDADTELNPWTEFRMQKHATGWKIISKDVISPGMATILLTNQ
jgi:hypothetical protein